MTYAQRSLEVKRGFRQAKRAQRTLDTAVERVERELARLIKRKTLVEAKSCQTLVRLVDQGVTPAYRAFIQAGADAVSRASI